MNKDKLDEISKRELKNDEEIKTFIYDYVTTTTYCANSCHEIPHSSL